MTEAGVRAALARACKHWGNQYQFATKYRLSPQYVCDVLKGRRAPGQAMLKALGLVRVVRYRKVEREMV